MINRTNGYRRDYMERGNSFRNHNPNSCGCERNEHQHDACEEIKLKHELQKVDFSLYDTVLYLDVYPNCQKALAYYKKLLGEREEILRKLAEKGHPINNMSVHADSWNWTDSPWPWDIEANV